MGPNACDPELRHTTHLRTASFGLGHGHRGPRSFPSLQCSTSPHAAHPSRRRLHEPHRPLQTNVSSKHTYTRVHAAALLTAAGSCTESKRVYGRMNSDHAADTLNGVTRVHQEQEIPTPAPTQHGPPGCRAKGDKPSAGSPPRSHPKSP